MKMKGTEVDIIGDLVPIIIMLGVLIIMMVVGQRKTKVGAILVLTAIQIVRNKMNQTKASQFRLKVKAWQREI